MAKAKSPELGQLCDSMVYSFHINKVIEISGDLFKEQAKQFHQGLGLACKHDSSDILCCVVKNVQWT